MQTLKELADLCETTISADSSDIQISDITLRSGDVDDGYLFAALPGQRVHGASFASEAVSKGALAVLTDETGSQLLAEQSLDIPTLVVPDVRAILGAVSAAIYGCPTDTLLVMGITGTSGKTTTSYFIESAFRAAGHSVGMIGTTGTRINGRPVPTSLTTPEAPDLQRLFAKMRDKDIHRAVMEVSSHALCLGRVSGTHFRIGGFLNLSQDHLDFHETMDDYFAAKAKLFTCDSGTCCDRAVICVDDEWGQKMLEIATASGLDPVTVSTVTTADYSAGPSQLKPDGTQTCVVTTPSGEETELFLPMPGRFNVANALMAIAMVELAGLPISEALAGIANVVVPGRLERVDKGQDFIAVVDYAHKPAAVAAVIEELRGEIDGRLAVVLGAGGDRDASKRAIMGKEAAQGADLFIITDDNPRSEDPATIRAAVEAGTEQVPAEERAEIRNIGDRAQAIREAIAWAQPGDAVLVAGKGHETGQKIGGTIHHFDDCEVVEDALLRYLSGDL
ncbi:MAG TPA: UDP-N-acetylmuramoyl-L-alanyl-D-glutamate--2,6-diaminopimelate ligase [Corynebacteriales bacterium]|nr:UDP-N-acetylmuramoyl-L-alanyl-D-glutamate--2,6-diaminopimelate ligase [Mycobacteriales bacterium]